MAEGNKIGKEVCEEYKADSLDNWMSHWQDVAVLFHPLESWIDIDKESGQENNTVMFDPIGEEALDTFTDGFVGSTMPKTEQWAEFEAVSFKDESTGREIQPSDRTKRAWNKASERFIKILGESNFYEAVHESIKDGGAFGNGCLGVFEGLESRLNFTNTAPGKYRIKEDEEFRPGDVIRAFQMTPQQIKDSFDRKQNSATGRYAGGLPEEVQKALDGDPATKNKKMWVLERIRKNPEARPLPPSGKTAHGFRAWIGEYVLKDHEKHFFTEGYYEKPWIPWRLTKSSQEKMGRGMAMKALPKVREIQKMSKEYIRMLEKSNDPGWLAHADSDLQEDGRAGGISIGDWDRPDQKPELLKLNLQGIRDLGDQIERERNIVRSMFFNDVFKIFLREDVANKELKAAQVEAMTDEKLPLMVGISNRFLNEGLKPLLRRAFMITLRGGAYDDIIDDLGGVNQFRIVFRSRIALAVKTLESRGILQAFNAGTIIGQIPGAETANMKVDWAGMLGRLIENSTAPSEFVVPDDEYQAEVQKLTQQQALAAGAAMAKDAGSAAQSFGAAGQ